MKNDPTLNAVDVFWFDDVLSRDAGKVSSIILAAFGWRLLLLPEVQIHVVAFVRIFMATCIWNIVEYEFPEDECLIGIIWLTESE